MDQFIVTLFIFAIGIVGMALALHFSRYKKRDESCCGGGHCSNPHDGHAEECESKKELPSGDEYHSKIVTGTISVK